MAPAALVAAALPPASGASYSSYLTARPAAPIFMQQQSGTIFLKQQAPAPGGTINGTGLPSSVLPAPAGQQCSVLNDPSTPVCSTFPGIQTCSTHCDSHGLLCSAHGLNTGGGTGNGSCSTIRRATGCSILAPSLGSPSQTACSAFYPVGGVSSCSTLTTQKKQGCSVENIPGATGNNVCSSFSFDPSGVANCSVLAPGGSQRSYCSAFGAGEKLCSAHDNSAGVAACSVQAGAKGVCTVLKGAASGQCSLFPPSTGSSCSVIGGAPGTDRCVQ